MKLEDGKTYLNGDGKEVRIMGTTKMFADYCWSVQGDWYERETGLYVSCRKDGSRVTSPQDWHNIVSEVA